MKLSLIAFAVLALAGCATSGADADFAASNRECKTAPNWDACISGYIARMEARKERERAAGIQPRQYPNPNPSGVWHLTPVQSVEADRSRRREESVDDAVAAGLLIDYATRPRSCMAIGGIVTC